MSKVCLQVVCFLVVSFIKMEASQNPRSQSPYFLTQQSQSRLSQTQNQATQNQETQDIESYLDQPRRRRARHEEAVALTLSETQHMRFDNERQFLPDQEEAYPVLQRQPRMRPRARCVARGLTQEERDLAKDIFYCQHNSLINKFLKSLKNSLSADQRKSFKKQEMFSVNPDAGPDGVSACVLYFCYGECLNSNGTRTLVQGNRLNLKKSYTKMQLLMWGCHRRFGNAGKSDDVEVSASSQEDDGTKKDPQAACSSVEQAIGSLSIASRKRFR